jgi:hypothetical protein
LEAGKYRLIGSVHRDLCLPESDISCDEPVHRMGSLEVSADIFDDASLIGCMRIGKCF